MVERARPRRERNRSGRRWVVAGGLLPAPELRGFPGVGAQPRVGFRRLRGSASEVTLLPEPSHHLLFFLSLQPAFPTPSPSLSVHFHI